METESTTIEEPKAESLVSKIAKLRMAVARFGEMDISKWWNTTAILGSIGEMAISRGFPKTHYFARARAVFAVATARSEEVFDPPDSYTLWRLPVEIEDQLEDAWATWLEDPSPWERFIKAVEEESKDGILLGTLSEFGLVSEQVIDRANRLRRADDLRSVPIKLDGETVEEAIGLLAAGYCCSEVGKISVPFIRTEEFPA